MALEDARHEVDTALTREGFKGRAWENTFGGVPSFLRRKYAKDLSGVDLAVIGVPFDQAVTNRPGARFGPRAIREASALQPFDPPYGWAFDPLAEFAIADYGDVAFDYARPAEFSQTLMAQIGAVIDAGCGTLVLGGDHSISRPVIEAHSSRSGPVALIQFDAHSDTWADEAEDRFDHGTMFYKAVKSGAIDPAASVQIGIRTENEDPLGICTIDAPEVHRSSPEAIAARIREVVGGRPAYVSFDIDVLDPAFAPGTGTPVWGGLASWQAAAILRGMAGIEIVGGDVVEVSPPFDTTGATAIAGAHAAVEIMCLWCWTRRSA